MDKESYARLKYISEFERRTIKEIVREAIAEYIAKREGDIKKDPFFKLIGSFKTKEGNWSERKDWRL